MDLFVYANEELSKAEEKSAERLRERMLEETQKTTRGDLESIPLLELRNRLISTVHSRYPERFTKDTEFLFLTADLKNSDSEIVFSGATVKINGVAKDKEGRSVFFTPVGNVTFVE